MIAGDPPIPTPPATSPLLSFGLDLEPAVAGLPRGINLGQMRDKHFWQIVLSYSMSMIYIFKIGVKRCFINKPPSRKNPVIDFSLG